MLLFEYPFKDFLALDRAVGAGELQGVVAWALSYRRFPVIELAVRTIGPDELRVELRLLSSPDQLATSIPFEVGAWDDLDSDTRDTLSFYARPDAALEMESRWRARGESSTDLEATRAAWDYLAFQYLSTWERDDEAGEDAPRAVDSLVPDRAETRSSFAPRETGADIEVLEAGQSICLLASSSIEQAAVGRAVFGVEAETRSKLTRWTVVDVDAESQLLVVRELHRRGDSTKPAGPLVAWFAPLWIRDARRLLEDAEQVSEVDCILGAGLRAPIVGGGGKVRAPSARGRGREVELGSLPPTLVERAPGVARDIAAGVRRAALGLSLASYDSESGMPAGFDATDFSPRRAARVSFPEGQRADQDALCGYRLTGAIRCHGIDRLLILEWTVSESDVAAAEVLASGGGHVRAYLVASTHAAGEIAALRSLQGAFALDHPA